MAIKVNNIEVISDSRGLNNIVSIDATTAETIGALGGGGGTTYGAVGTYAITLIQPLSSVYMGGATVSGSTLRYQFDNNASFPTAFPLQASLPVSHTVSEGFSGTWRLMSGRISTYSGHEHYIGALWLRIL